MTIDPISNLINQIKTSERAGKSPVVVPYSKMRMAVIKVLEKEGFVSSSSKRGKKVKKYIDIELNPDKKIGGVKRISKQSKRVYFTVNDIKLVKYGKGRLVISTPKGIMTGEEARKAGVGGEALFEIW
jgi:small subunit ribosomal protein S8